MTLELKRRQVLVVLLRHVLGSRLKHLSPRQIDLFITKQNLQSATIENVERDKLS